MAKEIFDVEAALKEGNEGEVADYLAKLHGIDRNAYLKEGLTDAEFLSEYGKKHIPSTETADQISLNQPSTALNVTGAAIGAGAPKAVGVVAKPIKNVIDVARGVSPAQQTTPSAAQVPIAQQRQFVSPEAVQNRVAQSLAEPRPQGPSDVVNWAMGKQPGGGQYARGYLGGVNMEQEAALHKQLAALEQANPGMKVMPGTSSVLIPQAEYNRIMQDRIAQEEFNKMRAQSAGDVRQQRLNLAEELRLRQAASASALPQKVMGGLGRIAQTPTAKRAIAGYNIADALQSESPTSAALSVGAAAAPYAAQHLPAKYRFLGPLIGAGVPATKALYNKLSNKDVEEKAAGGKVVEAGLDVAKKLFAPKATNVVRASEALAPHEGKWLLATQSDRMRSTGGDLGGPGFSKFQLEDPRFAEAAWAVGKQPTASAIANVNKRFPQGQAIWTPMIGSETQHHSNKHVYDMLTEEFNRQVAMGNLPPELRQKINARLAGIKTKENVNIFPQNVDVANPEHLKSFGDTFDRRGNISKVLSGEGVGGQKGRIIDYPGIMQEMTDPMTIGAPTHSLGTRLFTLTGETAHQPDLHTAFPYVLKGQDLGVAFNPIPKELALKEYINKFKEFKGREPGYYDLTRSIPSEQITDKYLRALEEAGHKEGGAVGYAGGGMVQPFQDPIADYSASLTASAPSAPVNQKPVAKDHLQGYLDWVIPYEGKLHNVKGDKGGLTNYGITAAGMTDYLGRPATTEDITAVTPESAREIYAKTYNKLGLQDYEPKTAILAMDAAVNQGPSWTRKALQQTGGDYGKLLEARMARYAKGNPKFRKGWNNRMTQLGSYLDTLPETGD